MRTYVRDLARERYSQFKRALERRNLLLAWTLAAELPKVPLADALSLLLMALDQAVMAVVVARSGRALSEDYDGARLAWSC